MIKILYFARLREQLATPSEQIELPPGVSDLAALTAWLIARGGTWAEALGGGQTVLTAVNEEVAGPQTRIRDGDQIAYFPPVTGG